MVWTELLQQGNLRCLVLLQVFNGHANLATPSRFASVFTGEGPEHPDGYLGTGLALPKPLLKSNHSLKHLADTRTQVTFYTVACPDHSILQS